MRKAYIITFITALACIFCFSQAMAQGVSNFGASRPQDSSITRAQLVLKAYATALPNMFLRVNSTGHVVLDTVETGTLIGGYGLVTNGDTISIDTALLNGAYIKLGDSAVTYVTPYQLAQAISSIPNIDTTSLSNRINQKLDTAAFGAFHRTYFDTGYYSPLLLFLFGDSYTVGSNATTYDSSYAAMLTRKYGQRTFNFALGGSGLNYACRQISANINPGHRATMFIMAGFNDFRHGLTGATDFNKTIRKGINTLLFAFSSLYSKDTIAAFTGANTVRNGSWVVHNTVPYGGKHTTAALTATLNNSISYSFTDSTLVINLIGSDGVRCTYSDYDIYIDGNLYGSFSSNNQTDGGTLASGTDNRHPVCHVVRGLSYGSHNVEVFNRSSDTLMVDGFRSLLPAAECQTGYWANTLVRFGSDTAIVEMNRLCDSLLYSVFYKYPKSNIETNQYYTIDGLDIDGVHWNNLGHKQFMTAIDDSVHYVLPAALAVRTYPNKNLLSLGTTDEEKLFVDPYGNIHHSGNRGVISAYSYGYGYYESPDGTQRFIRGGIRASRLYTSGDTTMLQHSSNTSPVQGGVITWLTTQRIVANIATPNNHTLTLTSNNLTLGGSGDFTGTMGQNSARLVFNGSGSLRGMLGTAILPSPAEHYLYVANSLSATQSAGEEFKGIRFYTTPQRLAIRTYLIRPTAHLHLGGGLSTAGGAFMKFHDSLLLGTPEKGAWEFNANRLFFTPSVSRNRVVLASDTTTPTSGQLLIGNSLGSYTNATITPGQGIIITNASGSITVRVDTMAIALSSYFIDTVAKTGTASISPPALTNQYYVDATTGNVTLTINTPFAKQTIHVTRNDGTANTVTIQFPGKTINQNPTYTSLVNQNSNAPFLNNGTTDIRIQ